MLSSGCARAETLALTIQDFNKYKLSPDEIDSLQGRSKNTVRSSYFFDDPKFLKEKYILNLNQVSINQEVNNIGIDSPEVLEIKHEKN